jgi:hypothetical protein
VKRHRIQLEQKGETNDSGEQEPSDIENKLTAVLNNYPVEVSGEVLGRQEAFLRRMTREVTKMV